MSKAKSTIRLWAERTLGVLVAVVVLWHGAAYFWHATDATANVDGNPDRSQTISVQEFVKGFYGADVDGRTLPLKLDPFTLNEKQNARLLGVYPNEKGETRVHLKLKLQDETPEVQLRLDQVIWQQGNEPSVTLRFGDRDVTTMFLGEGYDYWRFLTFRGSKSYTFKPKEIEFYDDFSATLADVMASPHTSATITTPDTHAWKAAVAVK